MKRRAILILAACLILIPAALLSSRDNRSSAGNSKTSASPKASTGQDAPFQDGSPPARKTRPAVSDLLPPGYQLEETSNGGCMLTIPGVGVYAATDVSVAARGLVFKGPITFAATKDGPWIGYAGEGASIHLAKDGTTKLSGDSAIIRENLPPTDFPDDRPPNR
ncbi:hypothetical protein [Luteolibacter soli]|uniref:Uncharacterized protein n=1 Tax=Luteolibacter soli TaxID=3135280 RepID=A0ABU9AV02_9BACT